MTNIKKYSSNDTKTCMILVEKFVRHNAARVSSAICGKITDMVLWYLDLNAMYICVCVCVCVYIYIRLLKYQWNITSKETFRTR